MIGKSTYIRSFTEVQHKQLKKIALEEGFCTVPDIFFYTLEEYFSNKTKIRLLEKNKIKLQNIIESKDSEINDIRSIFERMLQAENSISMYKNDIHESKMKLLDIFNSESFIKEAI